MEGWTEQKIGDLFNIKAGGDLQESFYSPCITAYAKWAIYANSLENKGLYGYTSKPRFKGDAVTITGRGDIGHAEYRSEDFDAIVRLLVLLPKVDVNCRYVTYYINSLVHFPEESTGVPQLTAPKVKRIKINIPNSTTEQTAIANILSKVDEAIAAVQTSIDAAERLKKSLMQNLLTGKMKPDGTFRTPEEFYTDPKFGKVPLGWEVKKIKDVADNLDNYRKPIKSIDRGNLKGVYPYYGAAGIVDYINDYLFDGIYVLFGEDGENLLSRKLPQAFIVKGKFWVNNHAHILQIHEDYDIELITYILEAKRYDNIVYGSAQPKINKSDLNKIKLIIPKGKDEQKKLSERIANIEKIVLQKQKTKSTLEDLKKSLMQNLLTGKIRIK